MCYFDPNALRQSVSLLSQEARNEILLLSFIAEETLFRPFFASEYIGSLPVEANVFYSPSWYLFPLSPSQQSTLAPIVP